MWNACLGNQGIGTGVTRVCFPPLGRAGMGVEGVKNTSKETFLLVRFSRRIPAAPMGHAQLQEKEPPGRFAGCLTRCRAVPSVGMTGTANAGGVTCSCPHVQL